MAEIYTLEKIDVKIQSVEDAISKAVRGGEKYEYKTASGISRSKQSLQLKALVITSYSIHYTKLYDF